MYLEHQYIIVVGTKTQANTLYFDLWKIILLKDFYAKYPNQWKFVFTDDSSIQIILNHQVHDKVRGRKICGYQWHCDLDDSAYNILQHCFVEPDVESLAMQYAKRIFTDDGK